jgi:hypothetical protein
MTIESNVINKKKLIWYIWLINNDIQYYKSNDVLTDFRRYINNNDDIYEIELIPKYTHFNRIEHSDITFCDIKFISKNGIPINNDTFIQQENSLTTCINEYNKLTNKIGFSFTIKCICYRLPYLEIKLTFGNVIKYINWDNNCLCTINIEHENPIITAYYYCIIRFYMEINRSIRKYSDINSTLGENVNYYLSNNSWYCILLKKIYNIITFNKIYKNTLELKITNLLLENENIIDNKKKLQFVYDEFHPLIKKTLNDYIFNKYSISSLCINMNNELSYIDNRANIYCNPFNLLYYHLSVINIYTLDTKRNQIKETFNYLEQAITNLINKNISRDVKILINIVTIKYFMNYFNLNKLINEYTDDYNYEVISYNKILILFNKLKLILYNFDYNIEDKIEKLAYEINESEIYSNKLYDKHKIILLFEIIIIKLSEYSKSDKFICYLKEIYKNYNLYKNKKINDIVYVCLLEIESIINDTYFMPSKNICNTIKEVCTIYENIEQFGISDNIDELNNLSNELYSTYEKLLIDLQNFKIDEEFKQMILEYEIIEGDNDIFIDNSVKNNRTVNNEISETNIDTEIEKQEKRYYISSWLGF